MLCWSLEPLSLSSKVQPVVLAGYRPAADTFLPFWALKGLSASARQVCLKCLCMSSYLHNSVGALSAQTMLQQQNQSHQQTPARLEVSIGLVMHAGCPAKVLLSRPVESHPLRLCNSCMTLVVLLTTDRSHVPHVQGWGQACQGTWMSLHRLHQKASWPALAARTLAWGSPRARGW